MKTTFQQTIDTLLQGENLTRESASGAMREIMSGNVPPVHLTAFLVGLRMKGETAEEIAGCADAMREVSVKVPTKHARLLDTCGTGGDQSGSFNISTAAAIVAAAAGVPVAKHGNRAVSSRAGSADVLEALGIRLDPDPVRVGKILDDVGITFLFAPNLHPAMKHAVGVRKELATRTIFNILGPLTNPAGAQAQVLGVFREDLTETLGHVLAKLGTGHAFVVHGAGGLDEIAVSGPTRVSEVEHGEVRSYTISPQELGCTPSDREAILGGDASENASIIRSVFGGAAGPRADIVVLNAAAAIVAGGKANDLKQGVAVAREAIRSGAASSTLERWVQASNDHTP